MGSAYLYTNADSAQGAIIRVSAVGSASSNLVCTLICSDPNVPDATMGPAQPPQVSFPVTAAQIKAGTAFSLLTRAISQNGTTDIRLAVLQSGIALGGFVKPPGQPQAPIVKDGNGDTMTDSGLHSGDQTFHPIRIG